MKRILCLFGWHKWTASMNDYIEEFGYVPLDNRIASNSTCERCGIKFKQSNSPEIPASSNQQKQDNDFLVWDKLFAKLAWRFKPMKSGDMFIDAEAVYEELKNEFNLTFKK